MKKALLVLSILVISSLLCYFFFMRSEDSELSAFSLIPEHAGIVAHIEDPVSLWKECSAHPAWERLKQNPYLYNLLEVLIDLEKDIDKQKALFRWLGKRPISWSWVKQSGEYHYLTFIPTGRSDLSSIETNLLVYFLNLKATLTEVSSPDGAYYKYADRDGQLAYALSSGYLILSSSESLLRESLEMSSKAKEADAVSPRMKLLEERNKALVNVFLTGPGFRNYLIDYAGVDLKKSFAYLTELNALASLHLNADEASIILDGKILLDGDAQYLSEIIHLTRLAEVRLDLIPANVAQAYTFRLNNCEELFYSSAGLIGEDKVLDRVESFFGFLDIDFQDFLNALNGDYAVLNLGLDKGESLNCLSILPARPESLKNQLEELFSRIKKRSPALFRSMDYRGFEIRYLGLDGLFGILLSDLFKQMDKPYVMFYEDGIALSASTAGLMAYADSLLEAEKMSADGIKSRTEWKSERAHFHSYNNLFTVWQTLESEHKALLFEEEPWVMYSFEAAYSRLWLSEKSIEFRTSLVFNEAFSKDQHQLRLARKQRASPEIIRKEEVENVIPRNPDDKKEEDYFENGQLKYRVRLRKGRRHGLFRAYHPNGTLAIRGRYKNGEKRGSWNYFDDDGNLLKEENF